MPLRLRSAGGGSVQLNSPVALATDVSVEVPGYAGAQLLTNKTPGATLQVQRAIVTAPGSFSAGNWTAYPGLSVTITPSSANSRILLMARASGEPNTDEHAIHWAFARNNTPFNLGDGAGSRLQVMVGGWSAYHGGDNDSTPVSVSFFTIDTPSTTAAVTYTVQVRQQGNAAFVYYSNRTVTDGDIGSYERMSSEIIAMEIAG